MEDPDLLVTEPAVARALLHTRACLYYTRCDAHDKEPHRHARRRSLPSLLVTFELATSVRLNSTYAL